LTGDFVGLVLAPPVVELADQFFFLALLTDPWVVALDRLVWPHLLDGLGCGCSAAPCGRCPCGAPAAQRGGTTWTPTSGVACSGGPS